MTVVRAGLAYFGLVFALGFVLGTMRTVWLAPIVGEARAILLELPFMLAASLAAAHWVIRRMPVPAEPGSRLWMGGIALVLLLLAELLLARNLVGRTPADAIAEMASPARLPGLIGQLLFALMPALLLLRR